MHRERRGHSDNLAMDRAQGWRGAGHEGLRTHCRRAFTAAGREGFFFATIATPRELGSIRQSGGIMSRPVIPRLVVKNGHEQWSVTIPKLLSGGKLKRRFFRQ